jgi:hypothetical protein
MATNGNVGSGAITTNKLANLAVTLAKEANGTANSLQGYNSSGAASVITAGTNITISGGQISSTGGISAPVTVANGGTGVTTLTTAYGTLVAGTTATGAVQTVSPGSSGAPLVSGGASATPSYTTLTVAGGGTGQTTLTTPYGTLCAGTTATGALQTVSPGTSGQILISGGASALPAYANNSPFPKTITNIGALTVSGGICTTPQITTAYDEVWLVIQRSQTGTGSGVLSFQGSMNNGSTWRNGSSDNAYWNSTGYTSAATSVVMTSDSTASNFFSGTIKIKYNYLASANPMVTWSFATMTSSGVVYLEEGIGKLLTAGQYDKFRFFNGGTSISSLNNSAVYGVNYN